MLTFQPVSVRFNSYDDHDRHPEPGHWTFPGQVEVRVAEVAIQSVNLRYDNGDHHVLIEQVGIDKVRHAGAEVDFEAFIGLRDQDKNPYSGSVTALIIADVVPKKK